jgi:16S rRNA (guanine966-N2)-methyltransferase
VKEALFSILAPQLLDARVLDLYAGSGALGFEALSRGAAEATFVERDVRTAQTLRESAAALGVGERSSILVTDAKRAAARVTGRYDIVFADPPYADAYPTDIFAALRAAHAIDAATTVVYEHAARTPAPHDPTMHLERSERYGEVGLSFLRPAEVIA